MGGFPALAIEQFDKAGGSNATIANIPNQSIQQAGAPDAQLGPTGLGADDAHVVWVLSTDVNNSNQRGCEVFQQQLPFQANDSVGSGQMMFSSSQISCAGVAVDDMAAYVAVIAPAGNHNGDDEFNGLGILRLGFDNTIESIATHVTGTNYAGPRRVYTTDESNAVLAVDPHAIGSIQKAAFAGHDDIPH
jgi:hypothetical protein